jgi:hypothetical protein
MLADGGDNGIVDVDVVHVVEEQNVEDMLADCGANSIVDVDVVEVVEGQNVEDMLADGGDNSINVPNLGILFFKLFKLSLISYFIFLVEISSHHFEESDLQQLDVTELQKVVMEIQKRNLELVSKVEILNVNIAELQSELQTSKVESSQLKLEIANGKVEKDKDLYSRCIEDEELMVYYTRFTPTAFESIFQGVMPLKHHNNQTLDYRRQFFLTLTKLAHNFGFLDLSVRFNVSRQTVSNYFHKWVGLLHDRFFSRAVFWPSSESLKKTMPMCFRMDFLDTTAIWDCFEIQIDTPHTPTDQVASFSSYKQRTTAKYLISVTPQSSVNFVSDGFCGRVSDKQVVIDSGILSNLKHGDLILADRGFPLEEVVASRGAKFMVPAFMKERKQLPEIETEETRLIANVRIHVERVIGVTRGRFKMLKGPIDRSFLNLVNESMSFVDKIVKVCCILTNFLPSVVPLD